MRTPETLALVTLADVAATATTADPLKEALASLLSHGPIGILALIALYVAWSKDKQLDAEREARLADAKAYAAQSLQIADKVTANVDKLAGVADAFAKTRRTGP